MNILLCCASGMSSSLIVQKMREEVKNRNLDDIKVGACAKVQLFRYLNEADVVLLAPQLSFLSDEINKMAEQYNVTIYDISMEDYGNLDVVHILDQVLAPQKEIQEEIPNYKERIYAKFVPIAHAISLSKPLNAITSAFSSILPVTMIGSVFTLLNSLPFKYYTHFLAVSGLDKLLTLGANTTIDMISLYLVFFIAYHLVRAFHIDGHGAGLLALICFFIITGKENGGYALTYLGSNGIFTAIFISILVGYLYVTVIKLNLSIHLPKNVPIQVVRSFEAIIPTFIIIGICIAITGIVSTTTYGNLHKIIYQFLQTNLTQYLSNNIFSFVFFNLMCNFLWFFGIHGGNTIGAITNPLYTPLSLENLALHQAGEAPKYIISSTFSRCYTSGGVGSMLSLSIIMAFFAKSQRYRTLGRISIPTTIFFINEPLLFGIPIILNPLFFIPLMFITPTLSIISYTVMKAGIIPIPYGIQLPWTTPPILYGLFQGSWKIALWEVIMNIAAGLMWFPFFKVADHQAFMEEHNQCHN